MMRISVPVVSGFDCRTMQRIPETSAALRRRDLDGRRVRTASLRRVLAARGIRAFGDGFVSLLLPVYLLSLGLSAFQVGAIAAATLFGSGALTLGVGYYARRLDSRTLLVAASALMAATGIAFAALGDFWPLLVVAIVGTLNPSSGDVSVFLPLEHAQIATLSPETRRTAWFARYSLVGALAGAVGALAAGVPELVMHVAGVSDRLAIQAMFVVYGALGIACAFVYRRLPPSPPREGAPPASPLAESRRIVLTLAALFSLDALGGGFIVQSMLALWLFERFDLAMVTAGAIFFWTGVLSALSYLVAARLAGRFGLVYTMVFTHLPSSVLLILAAFAPDLTTSVALLLVRSALSQMDVPTRSSFVMSVVPPGERAAAASVTSVPRSLAAASSPLAAGFLLGITSFGWPLVIAGALKIVYDLLFLVRFRRHTGAR